MKYENFHAILLEVLVLDAPASEKKRILLQHVLLERDRAYIETFDLYMIETASILLQRWGVPKM